MANPPAAQPPVAVIAAAAAKGAAQGAAQAKSATSTTATSSTASSTSSTSTPAGTTSPTSAGTPSSLSNQVAASNAKITKMRSDVEDAINKLISLTQAKPPSTTNVPMQNLVHWSDNTPIFEKTAVENIWSAQIDYMPKVQEILL